MTVNRTGRRPSRGQSMVELCLILPLMAALFLGVWSGAELISTHQAVDHAMRAGVRIAGALGPDGYPAAAPHACKSGAADPCGTDAQILQTMLPVLAGAPSAAVVTEIDIYQPADCTGLPCPPDDGGLHGNDPVNRYAVVGSGVALRSMSYPLSARQNVHPFETLVGVQVTFSYVSPGLRMFTSTQTLHSTVRVSPVIG